MKILLFLAACVTFTAASSQQSSRVGESIEWNAYYELGWHDFQGEPTEEAIGDAGSVIKITAKPYKIKNTIYYEVAALFLKNKSWSRDQSSTLLEHEQLHFDIAELYARKIRQKVSELNRRDVKDLAVYNTEVKKILDESNQVDWNYDIQTLHGALPKKQEEWKRKVSDELKAFEKFKKQKRIITAR